jgi:hypothetical protein
MRHHAQRQPVRQNDDPGRASNLCGDGRQAADATENPDSFRWQVFPLLVWTRRNNDLKLSTTASYNELTDLETRECLDCGYDLRGKNVSSCPECGRVFDPRDPTTWRRPVAQPLQWRRWITVLAIISVIFPFTITALIYASYLAGAIKLGAWPQPYRDDPKFLGIDFIYAPAIYALMTAPITFALTLLWVPWITHALTVRHHHGWSITTRSCLLLLVCLVSWTIMAFILHADPFRVFDWFMD